MKKIQLIVLLMIGLSIQAQNNKNAKYAVKVSGTCEHCKKRIEKAAYSVSGVKSANWGIEDGVLRLILNEQKTSLQNVETAIAKVGHDTKEIKSEKATYDGLPTCCLYKRE